MTKQEPNRRAMMKATMTAMGSALAAPLMGANTATAADAQPANAARFRYCLNTSTIRGQKLGIVDELNLAARAGYTGIEPWIRELQAYEQAGGSLKDLRKRIADLGMIVESAIGFAPWIVDDDAQRAAALEEAKRDMELVAAIGGTRIAAPPTGAQQISDMNLLVIAERYGKLIEVGKQVGVVPQVEVWGHSKTLGRLGEAVCVAVESGHSEACLLPDVYHIFRGGSDFTGLNLLSASAIHVFHVNDYPAAPPRLEMTDAHRVYPGDGVAPLGEILRTLAKNGCFPALSLELFNPTYWQQDAYEVVHTGIEKTRAAVAAAFA